nr:hypothetical protein [Tanacetum cinerariifolium]
MMGEINISTLTLEQYFRLIEENQALGMINDEFGGMMEKECKAVYKGGQMKTSEADAVQKVSSCNTPKLRYTAEYNIWGATS